jgi:ABC-type glycerol-3-phosphate transport system substrate-binding protein
MKLRFVLAGLALVGSCSSPPTPHQGTLSVWHSRYSLGLADTLAKTPGISVVDRSGTSWDELWKTGGADLLSIDMGSQLLSARAAGELADLSAWVPRMKASGRWISGLAPAKDFLPTEYQTWNLYYSPALFQAKGWVAPVDRAGWETSLDALKSRGIVPLALGSSFGWPALAWVSFLDLKTNGPGAYLKLLDGSRRWDDPTLVEVLKTLALWRDKGWIDPQAPRLNWPEALAKVAGGQAGYVLLGSFAEDRVQDRARLAPVSPGPWGRVAGDLVSVHGFAVGAHARDQETAVAIVDSYLTSANPSPGASWSPALQPTGTAPSPKVPTVDAVWSASTVLKTGILVQQFLGPGATLTAEQLAEALQSIPRP